jgi:membrane AbrB-like protein
MTTLFLDLVQILIGTLGGWLFSALGVPGGWLSGSAVAVILWGLTRFARPMPNALADAAMLVSGATVGASLTPEAIAAMSRYPLSLFILVVGVVVITFVSTLWLTAVSGWRKDDAVLASVPGALSTVMAVAIDRGGAVAQIAIVQNLRLFILIALLPSVVVLTGSGTVDGVMIGQGREILTPAAMATIMLLAVLVGSIFQRFGVAAPILLGATLVSTLGHATGVVRGVIPPVITTGGLILIGIFIANRFRGLDYAVLPRTLLAGLGSFTVGLFVSLVFAAAAAWSAEVGFADAMIAFAPGGLEAMTVLALLLGLDPLYVGVHHFVRFIGIGLVLPFLMTWLQKRERPR